MPTLPTFATLLAASGVVEGLAGVARETGTTVADMLGYRGPRAIVCHVMAARILAERREQALAAVPMFFPVTIVGG